MLAWIKVVLGKEKKKQIEEFESGQILTMVNESFKLILDNQDIDALQSR